MNQSKSEKKVVWAIVKLQRAILRVNRFNTAPEIGQPWDPNRYNYSGIFTALNRSVRFTQRSVMPNAGY